MIGVAHSREVGGLPLDLLPPCGSTPRSWGALESRFVENRLVLGRGSPMVGLGVGLVPKPMRDRRLWSKRCLRAAR